VGFASNLVVASSVVASSAQLACNVVPAVSVSFQHGDVPCRRLTWESATQRLLQAATIKAEEWPSTTEKVADIGNVLPVATRVTNSAASVLAWLSPSTILSCKHLARVIPVPSSAIGIWNFYRPFAWVEVVSRVRASRCVAALLPLACSASSRSVACMSVLALTAPVYRCAVKLAAGTRVGCAAAGARQAQGGPGCGGRSAAAGGGGPGAHGLPRAAAQRPAGCALAADARAAWLAAAARQRDRVVNDACWQWGGLLFAETAAAHSFSSSILAATHSSGSRLACQRATTSDNISSVLVSGSRYRSV
jgi:hypothetical protein